MRTAERSTSRSARASTASPSTRPPSAPASSSCHANRSGRPPTPRTASRPVPRRPRRSGCAIEQVSSVEHATVAGVPTLDPETGSVRMTAGLGRPLILTTLERDEAMRVLAADGPRRPLLAVIALAIGLLSLTVGLAWAVARRHHAGGRRRHARGDRRDRRRPSKRRPGSGPGGRPAVGDPDRARHRPARVVATRHLRPPHGWPSNLNDGITGRAATSGTFGLLARTVRLVASTS